MYGLEYDAHALNTASKALYIIFIILILLANGLLIFKNVRKCDFMYKPKTLTILSLAIGDVLLALFPLVLQTRVLFDIFAGYECSMTKPSDVYMYYLISFVHGCGLMVLGWEMLNRQNNPGFRNKLHAIIASSAPWLLGLLIILPLGFANVNWMTCVGPSLGQVRAAYIIAIILPAVSAVATSIFVNSRVSGAVQHTQTGSYSSPPHQYSNPPTNATPIYSVQGSYPHYPQHGYNPAQSKPHALPQSGCLNLSYQPDNSGIIQTAGVISVAAPSNAILEKSRLLVTSVVFLLLVTPYAIYVLTFVLNENNLEHLGDLVFIVLGNLFFFLMLLRPVVTPLLMLGYSDV